MSVSHRYLNERQVSELTGLSVKTLQAYRFQRRGIPYVKVGRSVRYLEAEVLDFMQSHRVDPRDTAGGEAHA